MKKDRKISMCDFIVENKTLCYKAFKQGESHSFYKTNYGERLVNLAREKLVYSNKTWDGDIYHTIFIYYKMIVIDGTLIDW